MRGWRGGILEAFGKLLTKDFRIYVYPLREAGTGRLETVETIRLDSSVESLFLHLVKHGLIRQLDNYDQGVLHIFSRDVLKRIKDGDEEWEEMVPSEIARVIKENGVFSGIASRCRTDLTLGLGVHTSVNAAR